MEELYSFVIDGGDKFDRETPVFITTLLNTGVRPNQIVAQCTPGASARATALAAARGIELVPLPRFLDGTYCNKLGQLDALLEKPAEFYVLCDTDLAFAGSLKPVLGSSSIRAKPVDFQNPPVEILARLHAVAGLSATPRLLRTTCLPAETWSVNCNGGLYIVPANHAAALARHWRRFAIAFGELPELFGDYFHHLDQIAFALAMLAMHLDVEALPVEFNFPLHASRHFHAFPFTEPQVLHYHRLLNDDLTIPPTGDAVVDASIARVNAVMAHS